MSSATPDARSLHARHRQARSLLAATAVLAALLGSARAQADDSRRVLLVAFPAALEDATRTALAPWSLPVMTVPTPLPAARAEVVEEARTLAARHRAAAVIWLAATPAGHTLRIYDRPRQRVLSRELSSGPPFDEPTAASVALTIKTLLRHSEIAPSEQRLSTPPAADVIEVPTADAAVTRYELSARTLLSGTWPAAPTGAVIGLEPRLAVGAAWWPAALPGPHGVGLRVGLGTGQAVAKSGFDGRLSDLAVVLDARRRMRLGRRLRAHIAAGAGLHLTVLAGDVQPDKVTVRVSRVRPSLELEITLRLQVARFLSLGAWLDGSAVGRTAGFRLPNALSEPRAGREVARAPGLLLGVGVGLIVQL